MIGLRTSGRSARVVGGQSLFTDAVSVVGLGDSLGGSTPIASADHQVGSKIPRTGKGRKRWGFGKRKAF